MDLVEANGLIRIISIVTVEDKELSYSLSWKQNSDDITKAKSKKKSRVTKLWMPGLPTVEDMKFLSDPEPLYPELSDTFLC